jgi:hypothetical protein
VGITSKVIADQYFQAADDQREHGNSGVRARPIATARALHYLPTVCATMKRRIGAQTTLQLGLKDRGLE